MFESRLLRICRWCRRVLIATIFLSFLPMSHLSADGHSQDKVLISVGEWPPFLTQALPENGLVARLISDVFSEAGYDVSFNFLPWVRAYRETLDGKYSATAVWMFKEDRTEDYFYSDPVMDEQFVIFYNNQRPFDWSSLDDLKGQIFGGGIGYSYGPEFDQALEDGLFSMIRQPTVEQNLRMLATGRIDLFIEERSVAQFKLFNEVPELSNQISYHPLPVLINQSFLLLPKSAPNSLELMDAFNAELEKFKQDGRYQSYFELSD